MQSQMYPLRVLDQFMTVEEVSRLTRRSYGTLANWRSMKKGPAFIRNAGRVLYLRDDVEEFINKSEVVITERSIRPKKRVVFL
ncbi:MAG: helix-turn-helix domain-containing protein [Ruthenibacterium sp.]